jgi:hypothetical protein
MVTGTQSWSRDSNALRNEGAGSAVLETRTSRRGALERTLRSVFSFPSMLAFLLIMLAVLTARTRFDDPDMWWQLKMGQVICTTHAIPSVDLFSYTAKNQAIIPQEWLGEVSIFLAYQWGGYSGMMLWLCGLISILLIAGYGFCSAYARNSKIGFVGAMLIWFFSSVGYSIRPQLIAYTLLVLELALIHLGRTRSYRWFFWLPVLFVVWINTHASFILGLMVACVYLLTSYFSFQAGSLIAPGWDRQCRRMLAIALVISAAACFLNPAGYQQIFYPVDNMLHMPLMLASISEWAPLNLSSPAGLGLLAVLSCVLLLAIMRRSELHLDELLLMAMGAWMALSHMRMLYVFGLLTVPVLCRQISGFWAGYDAEKDRIWPNLVMISGALLIAILAFPGSNNLEQQVEAKSPVRALEFIRSHHLAGPMLDDYVYGGYLIWAAPEYPVMIDGRADVYEWSGFLNQFAEWSTLESNPNRLLDEYKVHFCLLEKSSPMVQVLHLLPGWEEVYSDSRSVIFLRKGAAGIAGKITASVE